MNACSACGDYHGFLDICPEMKTVNLAILVAAKGGADVAPLLTLFPAGLLVRPLLQHGPGQ